MDDAQEVRQFMLFELSGEPYGVDLDVVQEVIQSTDITRVPQTMDFMAGVIHIRGCVIPVIDLKKRFGIGSVEVSRQARIMIVDIEDQIIGVSVDRVTDIVSVPVDDIDPTSRLVRSAIRTDYLEGFTEIEGELVKILNLERVLSIEELESLKAVEQVEHPGHDAPDSE